MSIPCNIRSPVGVQSRNVAVGNVISMIPELRLSPPEAGTPGEADIRSKPGSGPPVFPVTNSEEGYHRISTILGWIHGKFMGIHGKIP